jgi:hypothetical protein
LVHLQERSAFDIYKTTQIFDDLNSWRRHSTLEEAVGARTMGVAGWKLGGVGGAFFVLAALAQPVAADPIYHLERGQYSHGNGIGTFIIPSVAQGLLFYLDADDPPTDLTLTDLFNTSGEKVRCIAVTRFAFACSAEAALHAHGGDNDDERQPNGRGADGDGRITQLVNGSGDDPVSLFQTASIGNDPPAGPASVPEPSSLLLLASALISFGIAGRRRIRSH